jgi:hypothetical protein
MKRVKIFFFFIFVIGGNVLFAQTVILNVDRENTKTPAGGPNTAGYTHGYLALGFALPPDEAGSRVVFGSSANFSFGLRHKYKISGFYSLGWDMVFDFSEWKIKQEAGKTFPDTIIQDEQHFSTSDFGIGFYNRFNFDPNRGNTMGHYLDLGINGKWDFSNVETLKQDHPRGKATIDIDELKYPNVWQANVFARIGSGRWVLWASYRLTNLFKSNYQYNELPRLSAGVEVGLF